jgi:hypothetical protein
MVLQAPLFIKRGKNSADRVAIPVRVANLLFRLQLQLYWLMISTRAPLSAKYESDQKAPSFSFLRML